MKHLYIPFILFLLTVLKGVGTELLPAFLQQNIHLFLIPHWVLIFLLLIGIFYDTDHTYFSIVYSIIFGLIIDIVYTDILGVYMFSYTIAIALSHLLKKMFHRNFYATFLLTILLIMIADFLIYSIYLTIGWTFLRIDNYLYDRLLPTILANIIFLFIIYPMFKKRIIRWREEQKLFI